jgi:hypothetical protein
MPKFYDMGLCYEQNGGKFKVLTASDGSLMFAIFSRPEMAAFNQLYQDFMLLDGTHTKNVYDFRLIMVCVVDCLGFTIPVGVLLAPSESTDGVQMLCQTLGVSDEPNHTIMTDEGSAFMSYFGERQRKHLLCSHHFKQKAIEEAGITPHELKTEFLQDVSFWLFHSWKSIHSELHFQQRISEFQEKYAIFPSAV